MLSGRILCKLSKSHSFNVLLNLGTNRAIKINRVQGKEFGIKLNVHVYNNLIQAAICDNDVLKAQEVFAEMLKHNVHPDGRTYSLLRHGHNILGLLGLEKFIK